jgi:hypothetical protein
MRDISWKVFFIPLGIIYPLLILIPTFQHEYYYFISFFISGLILSWNFPGITSALSSKPLYYDDLSLDNEEKSERKIMSNIESSKKFQNIYRIVQQFILSITLALIIDYGIIQFKNANMELTQILIAIGGLASIYTRVIYYLGMMLVSVLYYYKKRERDNILNNIRNN